MITSHGTFPRTLRSQRCSIKCLIVIVRVVGTMRQLQLRLREVHRSRSAADACSTYNVPLPTTPPMFVAPKINVTDDDFGKGVIPADNVSAAT